MSATDPRAEFYSELDDWWAQLWALRIYATQPSEKIKNKFFTLVEDRCSEAGCWKLGDNNMSLLFSEFLDDLGEW